MNAMRHMRPEERVDVCSATYMLIRRKGGGYLGYSVNLIDIATRCTSCT
jgi:hypothetical protein